MKTFSSKSLKIKSFFLFIVIGTAFAQTVKCPFQYLYQFGDGIQDTGNSIRLRPFLPSTRPPYGRTFPGYPTGRWSDGRVIVEYTAAGLGLPNVKAYLALGLLSSSNDGVVFSVKGSTVLDTSFFKSRGISVPSYNIPLSTQIRWFRKYINPIICKTDCVKRKPQNSIIVFAHAEANDIGYALEQGKSIQEVTTYVQPIVKAQINAAREAIRLGANRIIYSTFGPLGCYPYILTALFSNDPTAYDKIGCLKRVNNVIMSLNNNLQRAFNGLQVEFPATFILGADFYTSTRIVINQTSIPGPNGNPALRSCCGIGGRYNYNKNMFCGSNGVPVCPNPNNSIYWDGLHFTQESGRRNLNILVPVAQKLLNCTVT